MAAHNLNKNRNINMLTSYSKFISMNKDINSNWIFGSGSNMTRMISQFGRISHPVTLGQRHPHSVTLGRSETKTRGSREQRNHYFLDTPEGPEYNRKIESGRSMVEMLGVLAIIGVLSIGGIMGYSYGMDKYRANETINDIQLRAMDLLMQLGKNSEPNLSQWPTISTAGYPIELNTDYAPNEYFIKVEKVPAGVCNIILNTMPEFISIWVNNAETENDNVCNEDELNSMEFSYEGMGCSTSSDCPDELPVCNPDGRCEVYPEDDVCGGCPSETPFCDKQTRICGDCKYDSDCAHLGDNYLCLSNDASAKYSGYNTCKPYTITNTYTVDGKKYDLIKIDGENPSWWSALKICDKLGKKMPSVSDLLNGWDGVCVDSNAGGHQCPTTATQLSEKLCSLGYPQILTSEARPNTNSPYYVYTCWVLLHGYTVKYIQDSSKYTFCGDIN